MWLICGKLGQNPKKSGASTPMPQKESDKPPIFSLAFNLPQGGIIRSVALFLRFYIRLY
jgi:hypothetical protein